MFERFTNQSRRVVVLAREEARMLNHNYIGTEHLLLGLLREGTGSAARAMDSMGVTLGAARDEMVASIGRGKAEPSGHIPFTPPAKKSLELSLRESLDLGAGYIGTGHLLLGLIRQGDNMAVKGLAKLGADPGELRDRVIAELRDDPEGDAAEPERARPKVSASPELKGVLEVFDDRLSVIEQRLGITPGELGEVARLRARVTRLEARLREHGIEPDEPGEPPAVG